MSYDVTFRVKAEGTNSYVDVGECDANITWNVGDIIRLSTGLPWINEANNGLCKDIIPAIEKGLAELLNHPEKYKPYEAPNGWGTVEGVITFFRRILADWSYYKRYHPIDIVNVTTFWIV